MYLEGISINKIRYIARCGYKKIAAVLTTNNIEIRDMSQSKRKYQIDDYLFKHIDTQEKAYFLGLMCADGCIYQNSIILCLSEKDKEILDTVNNWLFNNRPIDLKYIPTSKSVGPKNKEYITKPKYEIRFCNKFIANDLVLAGCTRKKSLDLKFPTSKQLPKHLVNHFIRGYFDGDGCIRYNKNVRTCEIVGSIEFCNSFVHLLSDELNIKAKLLSRGKVAVVRFHSKEKIVKFYSYIYNNCTIKMLRKYKDFETAINNIMNSKHKLNFKFNIPDLLHKNLPVDYNIS